MVKVNVTQSQAIDKIVSQVRAAEPDDVEAFLVRQMIATPRSWKFTPDQIDEIEATSSKGAREWVVIALALSNGFIFPVVPFGVVPISSTPE
jgi:hypothetical protein